MSLLEKYKGIEIIQEGCSSYLVRSIRIKDQKHILLKKLHSRRAIPSEIERFRHEWEMLQHLEGPSILKFFALEFDQGEPVLLAEDFLGRCLSHFLGVPFSIPRFLKIAIQLSSALSEIHRKGIIHRSMRPQNILLDPSTDEIKLIDFESASWLTQERQSLHAPLTPEILAYLSPEQTGRMSRMVDYRTDLYSLGMVFFEMLTGRLPFEAQDPLEWVHCHVARLPPAPSQIDSGICEILSLLILKLLSKAAEDRYQSAEGVLRDLKRCEKEWKAHSFIPLFTLGERDVSPIFRIPQKLYGREGQIQELVNAFDRVTTQGNLEVIFISGPSGIGKTLLVQELDRPLIREKGFFLKGKFDSYKREIPYFPFTQAFGELISQILSGNEAEIQAWKYKFENALGSNGPLIVDIIPQMEFIVGKQSPVPLLPLTESEDRFQRVFRQFIEVFSQAEHPVILFIDDLQWADAASLKFIDYFLTHPDTRHLLFVGAYRNQEVSETGPLFSIFKKIKAQGVGLKWIHLNPLSFESVQSLVAQTLHTPLQDVTAFAELILEKTGGNPFFLNQFLNLLYQDHFIRWDTQRLKWTWNFHEIEAMAFTESLAGLILHKLKRFTPQTQALLRYAACLGNPLSLKILSLLDQSTEEKVLEGLQAPLQEGLLMHLESGLQFLHDRVWQAAYSLISPEERQRLHLQIGRILLTLTGPDLLGEKIFDIVNHLNEGSPLITDPSERYRLAQLSRMAGKKAKQANAYQSAARYLAQGMALLEQEGWKSCYELTYSLYFERAQCEYLTGNLSEAERLFSILLKQAKTRIEKAHLYQLMIDLHMTRAEIAECFEQGIECLQLFGIELSLSLGLQEVQREYEEVWKNMAGREIEELALLPRSEDPEMEALSQVLLALYPPAYFTSENLYAWLSCRSVSLSFHNFNPEVASAAYAAFGMVLGPVFGKYPEGCRFGRLACDLAEKQEVLSYKARIFLMYGALTSFWTQPYEKGLKHIDASLESARKVGDLTYACYACYSSVQFRIVQGDSLEAIQAELVKHLSFVKTTKFREFELALNIIHLFIQNMLGLTKNFSTFSTGEMDQNTYEELIHQTPLPLVIWSYYVFKLQARFLSGDYLEAFSLFPLVHSLILRSQPNVLVPECRYYLALVSAALYDSSEADRQQELLGLLKGHQAQFKEWSDHCPPNFSSKHMLITAEICRIEGRNWEAIQSYEQSIRLAHENGFVTCEAIACELAAKFYLKKGFYPSACAYLREARLCYARWGAYGKVAQLEKKYPHLLEVSSLAFKPPLFNQMDHVDFLSIAKASQSISSEIRMDQLQEKLMGILFEYSGTQKGYLILVQEDQFSLQSRAKIEKNRIQIENLPGVPPSSEELPLSMLHYVTRIHHYVLIPDAQERNLFSGDPYIRSMRPRSILCLPVIRQGRVIALIYLENDLMSSAFTSDKLSILELLAGQAAISIQNAIFYATLQKNNEELHHLSQVKSDFITMVSHELRTPLSAIAEGINLVLEGVDGSLNQEQAKTLGIVRRNVGRLGRMVNNVLDYQRLDQGLGQMHFCWSEIRTLLEEVAQTFLPEMERRGLVFSTDMPSEEVMAYFDSDRMKQIMFNLLDNAIKFTGSGGKITLRLRASVEEISIEVEDTGIGIAQEDQQKLFEMFSQVLEEGHWKAGGSGVGLAVCKKISESHHGKIRVESTKGKGSRFIFEFPRNYQKSIKNLSLQGPKLLTSH